MADDVTVACKLINGLIIDFKDDKGECHSVTLKGAKHAPGVLDRRNKEPYPHEVGLTQVDRSFWEEWVKRHKTFLPLKNGLIFAQDKKADALAEAKDKSTLKTGAERLEKPKEPIVGGKNKSSL